MRRDECDRMIELVEQVGPPVLLPQLREILRTGQPRQASGAVGLVSRFDVSTLLELLPVRLPEWNRFYHDIVVRQVAYGMFPIAGVRCSNSRKFSMLSFCQKLSMKLE